MFKIKKLIDEMIFDGMFLYVNKLGYEVFVYDDHLMLNDIAWPSNSKVRLNFEDIEKIETRGRYDQEVCITARFGKRPSE